jgi:hypothetical protein
MSIIALLCHTLQGIPEPVCHEALVVTTEDGGPQLCAFAQAPVAQWKEHHPRYSAPEWTITGYKCAFGTYVPKDAL